MRRVRLGSVTLLASVVALTGSISSAAPEKKEASLASSGLQASSESMITAKGKEKPKAQIQRAEQVSDHPGTPAIRGPKLPPEVRAHLKAQLDARVDRDLVQIRELRKEAIELLTTFIKEAPRESAEMPEAMMRLGELLWENEREGVVERFKEWEKKPVDQRGPAPEINYGPSRELFGKVLKDYPWFGQYDLALYVDGFLATEQGKTEEATARFARILKEYPSSRFVPDAHMAIAEALFNKPDYPAALAEYEEVLKSPKSDLIGLALFKSAWCHWRLGNTDEATKRFVKVFEVTDTSGKAGVGVAQQKALDELQGEALKYLVEVFTEDDKNTAQDMYNFLTKIGGDRFAGKIVRALANTYFDQAHYERGIEAYELLIKLEPTSREAGDWVLQIAQGYNWLEDYPHLKATYDRAVNGYTAGSPWARTQADQANVAETSKKIEQQLREHAIWLNGKAQKDRTSNAEFQGAAELYDVYLSKFAKEPKAYQIEYYLAEIDFRRLNKNTDAATHYMNAARGMPAEIDATAPGDPLKRHDAIYNAIASLERVRLAELEARKAKGGGLESETDKKFAEALELYSQLYPNDKQIPELLYREGKLYYDYEVYDSAVKLWGTLLEKYPTHEKAHDAGKLVIDSFVKSKNYDNIETWARRLRTLPSFQDPKEQARLEGFILTSMFKQGEQKATANDHAGAAAAYLRAAKEYPKDPRAAQACESAEVEAKAAGDMATLKEAASLITGKDYRDKPESPLGAWVAATTMQAMGLFNEAAEYNEAFVANVDARVPAYQRYEHAKDAAYNAVVLRVAINDHDKAIADGNKFLALYGNSPEADEVVFQMGRAHQDAGRNKDAADLYKRYLGRGSHNQDHRVQGFVLLAKAQIKGGEDMQAEESLASATRMGKQLKRSLGPDGKFAAAQARYMQGERVLARFDAIKIEGDVKQLGKRLKQKAELLKEAATVFLDVVSFGVAEWTTAALYQVGHTYETFAKSLRDAPVPAEAKTDQEKEDFQSQIETFVVPIEEKALDAYENGWHKALDLQIYNQWTAKMRDALGRLNAELYPAFKEIGFDVRSEGPSPLPALIEAPRRGPEADKSSVTAPPKVIVVTPPADKAKAPKRK
ncbi:MAG TPA: tetratricopeptide repeat protein [Polyangiaceae bacterium]|nr:tetratricopeptide repeat protein [Polyangiaceae bacterium]